MTDQHDDLTRGRASVPQGVDTQFPGGVNRIPRAMMEQGETPNHRALAIAEGFVLKPGDRFLIVIKEPLSAETLQSLQDQLEAELPDVKITLLCIGDNDTASVYVMPADLATEGHDGA